MAMNRGEAIRLIESEHAAANNEFGTTPEAEAAWSEALDVLGIPLEHRTAAWADV